MSIRALRVLPAVVGALAFGACGGPVDQGEFEGSVADSEQALGLTFDIEPNVSVYDAAAQGVGPGDRICIKQGSTPRGSLTIRNVRGQAGSPVLITNCYGNVKLTPTSSSYVLKIEGSAHFKLSGRGTGTPYGIEIDGQQSLTSPASPSLNGLVIGGKSTEFEVESLSVHHVGFAGIMAKTDPSCQPDPQDPNRFIIDSTAKTSRDTFVQRNTNIHDNRVYDIARGEGLYIGHSFYGGWRPSSGTCAGWTLYPSSLKGVRLQRNEISNTGSEGIQLGCADENAEVSYNTVRRAGQRPFDQPSPASAQDNGIQLGEGTTGTLSHNRVFDSAGAGLIVLPLGNNRIYNNLVVNSGEHGLFSDDRSRSVAGSEIAIINNTFVNTGGDSLRLYSDTFRYVVWNNLLVNPGTYDTYQTDNTSRQGDPDAFLYKLGSQVSVDVGPTLHSATSGSNLFLRAVSAAGFVNPAAENYDLLSSSPAVNQGTNASARGVTNDLLNRARPSGSAYDVGAYEYGGSTGGPAVTRFSLVNADTDQVVGPLSNNAVINYATLGTSHINIIAETSGGAQSVVFGFDANSRYRVESVAPFTIGGDSSGNYAAWTPSVGTHTVMATPYTSTGGNGTAGTALTVQFTVQNQ